jgi:mono/diheme cytochrome c family protein
MKTVVMTLVVAALLLAACAAAFVYSGVYNVAASSPHGAVSGWIMEAAMHSSVERRAGLIEVPDLGDRSLILAGANDFEGMCVQCHGAPGREPGAVGKGLNPTAPDLSEAADEMTAAEIFWITKHGIRMTGMPAWGATHADEALWPVVAFVESLPGMEAAAYADLLESANGMGHHADDTAASGHSHAEEQARSRDDRDAGPEDAGETEHDHSGHEH